MTASMTVEERWDQFKSRVSALSNSKQIAFASFSCSRAGRYYSAHCGSNACSDPGLVTHVTDRGWQAAVGVLVVEDIAGLKQRLDRVCSELEQQESISASAAQEACFGCLVLLEILRGPVNAAQVQRVVNFTRDLTDMLIQERGVVGDPTHLEKMILAHPIMTSELQKHEQALLLLEQADLDNPAVAHLRSLAQA